MRDYDQLINGWDEVLECLRDKEKPDLEAIQLLIFETYHFEKMDIQSNFIPRNRLKLYKCISQFCQSLSENYPEGMAGSISDTCFDFASGVVYEIENGFQLYYGKDNHIPITGDHHIPAGCEPPWADITTYESFLQEFEENVEWLRDEYDEDDEFERVIGFNTAHFKVKEESGND